MGESATQHLPAMPLQPGIFTEDPAGRLRLAGTRCSDCGAHFFPRRQICAHCLSPRTETVPLSAGGVLYTFTIVHQSTPEFRTPYVLGYVDLPERVRVLAPLTGIEIDDVRTGMPLVLRVEPVRTDDQGRTILGYRAHRPEDPDE